MRLQLLGIPWQDIVGARVHAYFGVDKDLVWHAVRREIPPMPSARLVAKDKVAQ